jgi:hypothetical protein
MSRASGHRRLRAVPALTSPPPPPTPPPAEALARLLPPDVRTSERWRHEAALPVWNGVVWGRLGRGDLAFEHLDRVRLPALQPWIAAERGRILRELGLHAAAEALEWPALLAATDPVDAAMLRISLAADAVGMADPDRAVRRLSAAAEALAELPDGPRAARQRLRHTWVGVEVAWLTGASPSSHGLPAWDEATAAPSFPPDHAWGSDFHTAKGLLFAAVVDAEPRLLDASAALAPPALMWAVQLARADAGRDGAEAAARRAWRDIIPPPAYAAQARSAPGAARLSTG